MNLREKWNTFKANVRELRKEDLKNFLPKIDLKVDLNQLKGNLFLLFQEKLDHHTVLFTLEHMAMTGQVSPYEVIRYSSSKFMDADTYAKLRNYRKNGYHLLDPSVVPVNTITELPKLKFMITDQSEFSHKEASNKAAILQRLYGNRERKYGFRYLQYDVASLNGLIKKCIEADFVREDDKTRFYSRLMDIIERVEAFGYYLECNGNELKLYESKPASACVAQW